MSYLRAAKVHHKDPDAPEPNSADLTGSHGPFRSISADVDPLDVSPCIRFEVQNGVYKPRYVPPIPFLVMDLLLAFGGGCSVNDNYTGLSYVRLWGGNDKQMLDRIFLNAEPGTIVRQSRTADYRNNSPACFSKTSASVMKAEGKPMRATYKGRQQAIATALRYFQRNAHRSGIKITEAEYLAILHDAFALLDATHRHFHAAAA
ncbi:hypothetical protein [Microvirga lotononidis]|nr:hypothetical protein [Microvirga lotononidis]WQO29285.1 hypothetical protein U0023_09555 [Microvirga lotononidis]